MPCEPESVRAVQDAGGVLVRRAKHGYLYRLPNGATVLVAGSPGDSRHRVKFLRDLRHALAQPPRTP
jgi:hypothetical protein